MPKITVTYGVACADRRAFIGFRSRGTTRAIGPLSLEHLDPADDPRNTSQPQIEAS
jgi:hypothetical protein